MTAASPWSVPSALSAALLRVACLVACLVASLVACLGLACSPPTPTPSAEATKPATRSSEPQFASTKKPSPAVADPPWFSPAIFPGATVTKKGRSPADDQGRFTAQLLFTLPDGASLADCTDPIAKVVQSEVPELDREEKDGRVTLRGPAKDYEVIAVCGEAKGKMTAFVSYRWTAATASVAQ